MPNRPRVLPVLVLLAMAAPVLAAPAPRSPPASTRAAARTLTQRQRARIAEREVRTALRPWYPNARGLQVRSSIVQFNGDARNPVTGLGPIEVRARGQKGAGATLFPSSRLQQRFLVEVDPTGRPQILSRASDSRTARLLRTIQAPVRELLHDLVLSKGVRDGAVTAGLGLMAAPASPTLFFGAISWAGKQIFDGVGRRRIARREALSSTVAWARAEGKGGQWPTLTESYRRYQTDLAERKAGTTPVGLGRFAEQLSAAGL